MAVELVGNRLPGRAVDKPAGSSLSMGLSMALRRLSINPQSSNPQSSPSIGFLLYILAAVSGLVYERRPIMSGKKHLDLSDHTLSLFREPPG